jgi:hypothetical protein
MEFALANSIKRPFEAPIFSAEIGTIQFIQVPVRIMTLIES